MLLVPKDKIIQFLKAQLKDEPWAIYCFGSYAQNLAGPNSDLDLAVLVPTYVPSLKLWQLARELESFVGCDVDLVDLRAASTVLQYQIVMRGQRWWSVDQQVALFETMVLSEKTALDEARESLLGEIQKTGKIYGR